MNWDFSYGPWAERPAAGLGAATGRQVTWRLSAVGTSEASFTVNGRSLEAADIGELTSDLWIRLDNVPVFRGRIGASQDAGGPSAHTVTFSAGDYRALLSRRLMYPSDTLTFMDTDQSAIAWQLISQAQTKPGGNMGIIRGAGQSTGVLRQITAYEAGQDIGAAVQNLSMLINGFDWDITPLSSQSLAFDVWYPQRGIDRGVVLEYGTLVSAFSRQVDPGNYANAGRFSGAAPEGSDIPPAPVLLDAADVATSPTGRFDIQIGYDITLAGTLAARAAADLAKSQEVVPTWSVTLVADGWQGPNHIWLGDPVTLVVRSGRLDVIEIFRVLEIACAIDDNGRTTTTIALGSPQPLQRRRYRDLDARITALERR